MAKLSSIAIDVQKSIDGIWCPFFAGIELKIARANNPAYTKQLEKLEQPYLRQIRTATLDMETRLSLNMQAAAKCILVDWKNIEDESGNEIPYSSEKALEFLKNPAYVRLNDFVMGKAYDYDLFSQEVKTESVKN